MKKGFLQAKLKSARIARLATVDEKGRPHLVPICFVHDGRTFYTAVDVKPKRVAPEKLARVRHIRANPKVALLIDDYQEDWSRLWFILIRGTARLLPRGKEQKKARRLLRKKYRQYRAGMLPEEAPVIRIRPTHTIWWGNP